MSYARTYGTTRFQTRSQAKLGLPSAWLDGELNDIYTILNNMSLVANTSEWSLQNSTVTYVDASNFTVSGDLTTTYHAKRRIRANLNGSYVFSKVSASSYNGGSGLTTVTLADAVLTVNLTQIHYGIIDASVTQSSVAAEMIPITPVGSITATDIQGAIAEADGDRGAASGIATLDSNSKVVQDPASASTAPGNNSIPKLSAGGVLALPNAAHTINSNKIPHAGNCPRFMADLSADQSGLSIGIQKVQANNEVYDSHGCYDNATNYRFTPTEAGWYQVNACVMFQGATTTTQNAPILYKNGSFYAMGSLWNGSISMAQAGSGSWLVYLNGTTDYIELFSQVNGTGTLKYVGGTGNVARTNWGAYKVF